MNGDAYPTKIERLGENGIRIVWNDETAVEWPVESLRAKCPCATCREKKSGKKSGNSETGSRVGLPVLRLSEATAIRIESMTPVGNYAYSIKFSDGHSSGLFGFDLLKAGPTADHPTGQD